MSRKRKTQNRKQQKLAAKLHKAQLNIPFPVQYEEVIAAEYDDSLCDRIIRFCEEGAQIVEFAAELNVSMSALNHWARQHPQFAEAIETAEAKMEAYWWKLAENECREKFSLKVWEQMITKILQAKAAKFSSAENNIQSEDQKCVVILPEIQNIEAYKLLQ